MLLLLPFAFLAGAGTALSPCVLPVLPVVLSAGAAGGRRRPLGVATGIALSFTFATVALVYLIEALGLPDDIARTIAIVVLVAFGAALIVPRVGAQIEAWATRLVPAPRAARGEGFGGGLLLGAGLGLVYAPCAGPILAGVITVSAAQDFTVGRLAVALAYGLGSAVALYALMLGGRRVSRKLSVRGGRLQQAVGAVMLATAAVMAAGLDTSFQTAVANDVPGFLVNPTKGLEESKAVSTRLNEVRRKPSGLPVLGGAPELGTGGGRWFNTPGGRPLTLAGLRGRVVLVDFWTYTCINCIRTLPYVKSWDRRYRHDGLTVIGVHTPEFPFERDAGNVERAIEQNGIRYPVAQDNDYGTWDAFSNQYWPAKYLIDATGHVRYAHFGEGDYDKTEHAIQGLLGELGRRAHGHAAPRRTERPSPGTATPETYLGAARAQGFLNGSIEPGVHDYPRRVPGLPLNGFLYSGRWRIGDEDAVAEPGARLSVRFRARRVFLVLGSPGRRRMLGVSLDGAPLPDRVAGSDVHGARAAVGAQRLYRLVDLGRVGEHTLTLDFEPGIAGYAFTFG